MNKKNTLGKNLKKLRTEKGLTQKQVAELIGLTEQQYKEYETGKDEPFISIVIKLAVYYNISMDYITGRYISASEKAAIYKKQLDELNRQGKKDTSNTTVKTSREEVAKMNNTSGAQVRRYIRLNYLTNNIKEMVDKKILPLRVAVEISYLSNESQKIIEKIIEKNIKINLKQAEILKNIEKNMKIKLNENIVIEIIQQK